MLMLMLIKLGVIIRTKLFYSLFNQIICLIRISWIQRHIRGWNTMSFGKNMLLVKLYLLNISICIMQVKGFDKDLIC